MRREVSWRRREHLGRRCTASDAVRSSPCWDDSCFRLRGMAGEFLGVLKDPMAIREVVHGMSTAVAASYALEGGRRTQAEDGRRAKLCVDLVRIMRGDCGWTIRRIVDELPEALRARVRGEDWEPPKGVLWTGPNGRILGNPANLRGVD